MENIQLSNILRIQEASKQDRLVIFVGAGVSANSGVPMWGSLIDALRNELPESLKDEKDDLKIAQLYKDSRGHKEYIEKVKESLMFGKISPNPIHNIILDLKPCHIITTNYDDLIEQAVTQKYQQYYVVRKDEDLPYTQYQNTLIKMHGDFETGNIVLTESDYYNYPKKFPLIRAYVQSIFASKLILFIGFSFNDMNLKMILSDIDYILKENMQRVYFLTNKCVDSIQRTYYENKGINIVSLPLDDVERSLREQSIKVNDLGLVLKPGITLYKQLYLVKNFKKEKDLINYICGYVDSCKDEIRVFGDGLGYIIPKEEQSSWNYHSSGLQINSPYIKNVKEQLKTFSGRRKFIIQYKDLILEIRKQAYINRVFSIDGLRLINKKFYRNIYEYFPCSSTDYFYELDYINLSDRMKKIRSGGYKSNISDLELPFILYRLGEYYQAYLIYKELASVTWKNKKYILYFICMYNIYSIRYGIRNQLEKRRDIDSLSILEEIEKFDLPSILNKLPIDIAIKHIFEDLLSYHFHGSKLVDAEKLKEDISNQRKSAENGGCSSNSFIYLLESKFYQEFDFCNENCIICDNNSYIKSLYYNVASGVLNSHVTLSNKRKYMFQTKVEKLSKEHLLLLIFHIENKELLNIIKQYDIKQITLSKDGIDYLHCLVTNLNKSIISSGYVNYIVINQNLLRNIVQNIISIANRVGNNELQIANIYVFLNYVWDVSLLLSPFSFELRMLVDKIKPNIDSAKLLINKFVFNNYRHWSINQPIFQLSLLLKDSDQTIDDIYSLDDIPDVKDVLLGASIFEALNKKVQHEMIDYFKENIKELYYLLILHEDYHIPILEEDILKKLLDAPCFDQGLYQNTEEVSCSILARIRKDSEYNVMYGIIDDFAKHNTCFQFFLDPLNFSDLDMIRPTWVCYCDDDIIQKLLDIRIIKEKVKEYITNDNFGKLEFDRIWELL